MAAHIAPAPIEIEQQVGDALAGAVIGILPAATALVDREAGGIEQVTYFGTKIVLWRGESGELFATDPYCLHLGGNLAISDPANAVGFLGAAVAALPAGAVGAYEIGNEPDVYGRSNTFQVGGKTITRREVVARAGGTTQRVVKLLAAALDPEVTTAAPDGNGRASPEPPSDEDLGDGVTTLPPLPYSTPEGGQERRGVCASREPGEEG